MLCVIELLPSFYTGVSWETERSMTESDDNRTAFFLQHFLQSQQRIRAYIYSLLHNWTDTQDVFQSVSLVLWKKFDHYDPNRDFEAWAYGITLLEVRQFLRSTARQNRLCFDDDVLEHLSREREARYTQMDERSAVLQTCLGKLKHHDRNLVREAYTGQVSIKSLAAQRGRPVQTLYNRLNLIRHMLMQCMQKHLTEEGALV